MPSSCERDRPSKFYVGDFGGYVDKSTPCPRGMKTTGAWTRALTSGANRPPEPTQLPPSLRLIRRDLEDAQVLLRGGGPVPGLDGGAGQAEPGLEVARILAEHHAPLVHRLVVLLGLPEPPRQAQPEVAPPPVGGHRLPVGLEGPRPLAEAV